jgi:DNA primase
MNEVDQIKDSIDIVEFIRQYIELHKAGGNYRGLCPFHSEKTPSFMVSSDKQIFKCFGCFPKGSLVVTDDGYKSIEKLKIGDKVLTHKNKFRKVEYLYKRQYKGGNIRVVTRNNNQSIDMTSDHKVFAIKTKNCKQKSRSSRLCQKNCKQNCAKKYFYDYKLEKYKASELKIGDYLVYPIDIDIKDCKKIKIFDYKKYKNIRKRVKTGFLVKKFPEKVLVNSDFLKLLGYWIAEGSVYARGLRFSLGSHEKDFALEIKYLVKRVFGLDASLHFRKNNKSGIEISVSNANLCKVFAKLCGKGAQNKKIPQFCMKLPLRKQKVLINAILKGDGTISKKHRKSRAGRKSITTISRKLSGQIRDILLRCNFIPSIYRKNEYIDKNKLKHKDSWTISWMPRLVNQYCNFYNISNVRYWTMPIKKIEKYKFDDRVYNLLVEKDHSYIVDHVTVGNCGEGGDVFEFLMKIEGLNFYEALKMLAERSGIQLSQTKHQDPKKYKQEKDTKSSIYKINTLAMRVFHKILLEHNSATLARKYLKKRKIDTQTIKKFMIGYAPSGKVLLDFLIKKGFRKDQIVSAGSPDRFFKRIMFPIFDRLGNTIAFTGRTIEESVEPKYLNTCETMVFNKSKTIYGLNISRKDIRQAGSIILMEGQMDVVLSHQSGVSNVVATSGTALTYDHLKILSRYATDLIFCFDQDVAGQNATKKAISMSYELGISPFVISIPDDYKDVGEVVEKDEKKWQTLSRIKKPAFEWLIEKVFTSYQDEDDATNKKKIARELIGYLDLVSDPMEFKHYQKIISMKLSVNERIIDEILDKYRSKKKSSVKKEVVSYTGKPITNEQYLMGLVLLYPKLIKVFIENITQEDLTDGNMITLYKLISDCYNLDDKKTLDADVLFNFFESQVDRSMIEEFKHLVFQVEDKVRDLDEQSVNQEFLDHLTRIKDNRNKKIKEKYAKLISQAEEDKDINKLRKILKKFQQEISKK